MTVAASTHPNPNASNRIHALDLARSIALAGMTLVNFHTSFSYGQSGAWAWPAKLLTGKAAALFVILAGIGTQLAWQRAQRNPAGLKSLRKTLAKRALFLWLCGWAFFFIWPADILHFYAVYMLGALLFVGRSARSLLLASGVSIGISLTFLATGDYEAHWNFLSLDYAGLWSLDGFFRNLFFNGFHPVFPWVSFYLIGMAISQYLPLATVPTLQRRNFAISGILLLAIGEIGGLLLNFPAQPMPPSPFYILSGSGTSILLLALIFSIEKHLPKTLIERASAMGRLAFTHYIGHVLLGMGIYEEIVAQDQRSPQSACIAALLYILFALVLSQTWKNRFGQGPMEALLRKFSG